MAEKYYCKHCGSDFSSISRMKESQHRCSKSPTGFHEPYGGIERDRYPCAYCGSEFSSISRMKESQHRCSRSPTGFHWPYEGIERDRYSCVYCGSEYSSISRMTESQHRCSRSPTGFHLPSLNIPLPSSTTSMPQKERIENSPRSLGDVGGNNSQSPSKNSGSYYQREEHERDREEADEQEEDAVDRLVELLGNSKIKESKRQENEEKTITFGEFIDKKDKHAREIGLVSVYVCLPKLNESGSIFIKENCKLLCSSFATEEYFIDTEKYAYNASIEIQKIGGIKITIPKKNIKNIIKSNKVQDYLLNNNNNDMMAIKYHGGFAILSPSSFSNLQLDGNQDEELRVDSTHYLIWIKEENLLTFLKKYNSLIKTIKENFN